MIRVGAAFGDDSTYTGYTKHSLDWDGLAAVLDMTTSFKNNVSRDEVRV